VVSWKNWLCAGSPDGAVASATFFSLIETAKANALKPYGYLRHIFKNQLMAKTEKDLKGMLRQNIGPDTIAVIGQDYRPILPIPWTLL
jgi:transposase